ncbi:MAG: hypothetical protein WB784_12925 [Rhodanobacteraceae bacterium]
MSGRSASVAILVGGFIAGALDIAYAIVFSGYRGISPEHVLQGVASGVLGAGAYAGGLKTEAWGLALHFLLAFLFATIFYCASRFLPVLVRHAVASGVIFGLFVFAVMNFIVLPLSAYPYPIRFSWLGSGTNLLSHMFLFGVPIAIAVRKASLPAFTNGAQAINRR